MISFKSLRLALMVLGCWISSGLAAQSKYSTQTGEIRFTSKAELELIKASSSQVQGVLDISSRQFAFLVNMRSFEGFNSALQRKHFNENYMESEKFPAAKFSGKIIEEINLKEPGVYELRAKGELDIHNQKQTRIIKGKITVKGNEILVESTFTVPLADHDITIPKIVSQKIATEILVEFKATLHPQTIHTLEN
jgi:hypothetical protein